MNQALQQLRAIHLPDAINMWPIAPAWLMLYAILLIGLIYGVYAWIRYRKKIQTIKFAMKQLEALRRLAQDNPQRINIAAEISTLMRRTALYYFKRDMIAGLSGQEWLDFLNRTGQSNQFRDSAGRMLLEAPYQNNVSPDLEPLFESAKKWLQSISKLTIQSVEK